MSAKDILKQIKDNDVKFVDLRFTDPRGKLQHKHHHEVAAAQHELSMIFNTLVAKADETQIYKYVVHNVAHAYGKTATFMPKPVYGDNGTGMHVHQSIWKDGNPLFAGDEYAGLSETCLEAFMPVISYRSSKNRVNTRVRAINKGNKIALVNPETKKPIVEMSATLNYKFAHVAVAKDQWRIVCFGDDGDVGVGDSVPDDDGGNVQAMMDPITAGVIIVAILTTGGVAVHAINQGATMKASVNKDGVSIEVDGNGPDQLPDNGGDPQLPGE
ncbi:Glutamine synthetase [Nymphon striatum]|nr:Glutamine synthetase [Nymphon striatum]